MLRSLEYADTGGRWSGLLEEVSDSVRHEALTIAYRDRQDQAIAADARARGCATLFDWMEVGLGGGGSTLFLEQWRSEEHTSELQSLMRISYAVFCLKKK